MQTYSTNSFSLIFYFNSDSETLDICELIVLDDNKLTNINCNCISLKINQSKYDLLLIINWTDTAFAVINGSLSFGDPFVELKAKYCRLDDSINPKIGSFQKIGEYHEGRILFEFGSCEMGLMLNEHHEAKILLN